MFPANKMLQFLAFTTTSCRSHRAWICSLANIVSKITLFSLFQFLERTVLLCGVEPLKSVLLFLLKAAPGKLLFVLLPWLVGMLK